MRILGRFCLISFGRSGLQLRCRFLQNLLCLIVMEFASFMKLMNQTDGFGCGFLVFGCFPQVFILFLLCFLFVLGFKFLHFKGHSSPEQYLSDGREKFDRFSRGNETFDAFDWQNLDCNDGLVRKPYLVDGFNRKNMVSRRRNDSGDGFGRKNHNCSNRFGPKCKLHTGFGRSKNVIREARNRGITVLLETEITENDDGAGENESEEGVISDEDQIVDVMTLRELVKRERKRGDSLYTELEKERVAAASAAEEAMAMLFKLQSEKSAVELEAKQYKRIAEQKQVYDQEVIQGLQWMVMKHEEERSVLEDKLRLCVQKLEMYSNGDGETDIDGFLESLVDGETKQRNIMGSAEIDFDDF